MAYFRGGTSSFSKVEENIVSAVADELDSEYGEVLLTQLRKICLVQRPQKGLNAFCYYPKNSDLVKLPFEGYEYCLAKVSYVVSGKKNHVRVFLHNGLLQSVEGRIPTGLSEQTTTHEIELHPKNFVSVTDIVDNSEHAQRT